MNIPAADFIIYLNLPADFSISAMEKEGEKEGKKRGDLHERDKNHLENARKTYLEMAENNQNWILINCLDENNQRISVEELNNIIWDKIKHLFLKNN
jgi:thymidylate kinase